MTSITYGFYDELLKLAQDGLLDYQPIERLLHGSSNARFSPKRAKGVMSALAAEIPSVAGSAAKGAATLTIPAGVFSMKAPSHDMYSGFAGGVFPAAAGIGAGFGGTSGLLSAIANLSPKYRAYLDRKARVEDYLKMRAGRHPSVYSQPVLPHNPEAELSDSEMTDGRSAGRA